MDSQLVNIEIVESLASQACENLKENGVSEETFLDGTVRILSSGSAQDLERLTKLLRALKS